MCLGLFFIFWRSSQFGSGESNSSFITIGEVLSVSVEFVCQYRFGITPVFGFVSFNGGYKSLAFVEIVPADLFNGTKAIDHTDFQFGSKFDGGFCFSSDNGSCPWLADTYNPIVDSVGLVVIHFLLLGIEYPNDGH